MACRDGETDTKTRFRSERFYNVDDKHYFSTREGREIGPYGSKKDAEEGLQRYLKCIVKDESTEIQAEQAALEGSWANTHFQ